MIKPLLALMALAVATPQEPPAPPTPVMRDVSFWSIIDASRQASPDPAVQAEWLRALLSRLDADTLVGFQNAYDHQVNLGFSYDVWDLGLVLHGSMDEERFRPFRCWLVAQGRQVYSAALSAPDTLAKLLPKDVQGPVEQNRLCYIGAEVWAEKTGSNAEDIAIAEAAPTGLSGLPFGDDADEAADAARHFPELAKRFGPARLD